MSRDNIRAEITHQTDRYGGRIGSRLAEPTGELKRLAREVREGDTLNVEYHASHVDTNAAGVVSSVEGRDVGEGDSIDIRFGDGCYLHLNVSTGDYYFQDRAPESPANGREVHTLTLRSRGNS